MQQTDEITHLSARRQLALIQSGALSCAELMAAHCQQIERSNPDINAIVNKLPDLDCLALADAADRRLRRGDGHGALFGLPVAIKDLAEAEGFPTTLGTRLYDPVPASTDSIVTARIRAAGAIIIGKTNVPEFGLGSHTFNEVFGVTRNPHDPSRSAGGSSGGAAAALASCMLPLADGSDMGGSLRNPASFCGVVGMRPGMGRVPSAAEYGWAGRLSTQGPMARNVQDAALLLSVMAGENAHDPVSLPGKSGAEITPLEGNLRCAWTVDFDGSYQVDAHVATVFRQALEQCPDTVECVPQAPDIGGAMDCFQAQRAFALKPLLDRVRSSGRDWRRIIKDTAVWNLDRAAELDLDQFAAAEQSRTRIYRRFTRLLESVDFLLLPTVQVLPFPVEQAFVSEINGVAMPTYLDWMSSCCVISITGLPAISIPCGYSDGGLPVGLQIVAPPHQDMRLLRFARTLELAFEPMLRQTAATDMK